MVIRNLKTIVMQKYSISQQFRTFFAENSRIIKSNVFFQLHKITITIRGLKKINQKFFSILWTHRHARSFSLKCNFNWYYVKVDDMFDHSSQLILTFHVTHMKIFSSKLPLSVQIFVICKPYYYRNRFLLHIYFLFSKLQ